MRGLAALACGAAVVLGCDNERSIDAPNPDNHALALPSAGDPLPDRPGKKEYAAVCTACHSALYVTDQPELTKDGWGKVIGKMTKSYGATVPEELRPAIVDYLVAVHGKGE